MNAPNTSESTALAVAQQFDLSPRNFEEAWRMAEYLADSDMVPKDFKGKPANCLVAIQWGAELGLKTMQAIQNIAVINGRPSLWGDVMLALVRNSPLCEYVVEGWNADGTAWCKAKRRGEPEQMRDYSVEDAKVAGLHGKQGPWQTSPKRMRQMRARGWALRDVFTDVLKGLHLAEEAMDMPPPSEKHMGAADVVGQPTGAATAGIASEVACWPADLFALRLPEWRKAIADNKATADAIIAKAKTKHPLTAEQEQAIREPIPAADTATDVAPKVTYAQVDEKMRAARTADALNEAAGLITSVADEQQRAELAKTYEELAAELTGSVQ